MSSRDAALSNLTQQRNALEQSPPCFVAEIERIGDTSLKQIQAECGKVDVNNDSSPLLSVPTEVTCMIFDFSVASRSFEEPEKPLPPEVVISHVCKQWRDVSLNYTRLWARFFFRAKKVESICCSLVRFDEYIKRSGSQNLELFLDFDQEDYRTQLHPTRLKEKHELLDMAIKQVERWKTVTLMATFDLYVESRFLELKSASVSNLEYFVYSPASPYNVAAESLSWSLDISSPGMFRGGAPKLRYFLFDCSSLTLPPLSNITTLRLETLEDPGVPDVLYTFETFLTILLIPSLTNLSLVGHVSRTPGLKDLDVIDMKNLKHLRYSDHEPMTLLLPFLRAPLLETLVIHNHDRLLDEEIDHNTLGGSAGSYFFPSLETLILIDMSPMSYKFARRMKNLSKNVKNILISHEIPAVNLVGFLQEFNDDCWPRLASITVNAVWDQHQVNSLLDLVRSRPMDGCLKLRLFKETHSAWKIKHPSIYEKIVRLRYSRPKRKQKLP